MFCQYDRLLIFKCRNKYCYQQPNHIHKKFTVKIIRDEKEKNQ